MSNKSLHLLFVLVLFTVGFSYSQDAKFEWGHNSQTTTSIDQTSALTLKNSGEVYHAGYFQQSLDADPGIGVVNIVSNGSGDCFIQKFDENENLIWVKSFGGPLDDRIDDITCDSSGNIICMGYFKDTVDFDPGTGVFNLSTPNTAFFVLKLDVNGNFLWAFAIEYYGFIGNKSLSCDSLDNIYIIGYFQDSIDFDPGLGEDVRYASSAFNGFVAKYTPSGNYIWGRTLVGSQSFVSDLKIASNTDVIVVGSYYGTVDFDPGAVVQNETNVSASLESFVWRLDSSGNYVWSKFIKGVLSNSLYSIVIDNNFIYSVGRFQGSVDFDPGPAVNSITSYTNNGGVSYQSNLFLAKWDDSGQEIWTDAFLGTEEAYPDNIDVDGSGNIYITGRYEGTYDFDPSSGVYNINESGTGTNDFFVVKISENSSFVWAKAFKGQVNARSAIAVDPLNEDVYCSGSFQGGLDLDPGYGLASVNAGSTDYYLAKLEPCVPSHYTDTVTVCSASSYQWINGKTYTSNNNTDHYVLEAANGCDSIVRLNLTFGSPSSSVTSIAACDSYTWTNGVTYTSSTNVSEVFQNVSGCDSTSTLSLTIYQSTTGADVVQACGQYTWIDGNTYTSNNNTAQHILTNSIGCDSLVTLDLTFGTPNSGTDVISACESYTWIDGNTYTSSNNTATYVLQNTFGCDSTVTLDLTINPPSQSTEQITACFEYTWIDGVTYYSDNDTSTVTLTNALGCDSIITLDLTINNVNNTITNNDPELVAPSGMTSYQWLDCNNNYTQISGETSATFVAQQNGLYAVQIDDNGCVDTSTCEVINQVGILELGGEISCTVHPNPTTDKVTIEFHEPMGEFTVEVVNPLGELIENYFFVSSSEIEIAFGMESGLYFVRILTDMGVTDIPIVKL